MAVLSGGDVDHALVFVDTYERAYFPFPVCNLPDKFSVLTVMIEMTPSISFALPEK